MGNKERELSFNETMILNVLKSLDNDECITIPQLACCTGLYQRSVYELLESMRRKGIRVISNKSQEKRGTYLAQTTSEWQVYLLRREREVSTHIRSIEEMKKSTSVSIDDDYNEKG